MDKKKSMGLAVAIIAALAGGGWAISLDFSTTIGDTITTNIVNEAMKNEELREIGTQIALDILCSRVPDDPACNLVP